MEQAGKQPRVRYDLQERLLGFSAEVLNIVEALPRTRSGGHVAAQLVRCATSPLANHAEAQSAESQSDFVHKMKVGLKELRETRVWLMLVQRKGLLRSPEKLAPILAECDQLISIFVASIRTAQRNAAK